MTELARVYRLRSVGGSSAGAIAAAATAAAELDRAGGGFERLARLPQDLSTIVDGGQTRLSSLFQPQREARRLFRVLVAGLGRHGSRRVAVVLLAAVRAWAVPAALGLLVGLAGVVAGFVAGGPARWVALVLGLLLGVLLLALGTAYGALADLRGLPGLGFGLCDGMGDGTGHGPGAGKGDGAGSPVPALTPWLHQTLQHLAGRTVADPPLTFGDLDAAGIELRLMTTDLARRQPLSLPGHTREYYFDPAQLRTLFPEAVVRRMEQSARAPAKTSPETWNETLTRLQCPGLRRFPDAADLPVLVAVRMSLSFPGLISAVPLRSVDHTTRASAQRRAAIRRWRESHPGTAPEEAVESVPRPTFGTSWFSDGGICANLPLHFFDNALPTRPTFAIDLTEFPPDRVPSADEDDNSYLPGRPDAGLRRRQVPFEGHGLSLLVEFLAAIVTTARTWVDEAQLVMPGYRDRIVTVYHRRGEGGLNLDMPAAGVAALSRRGQGAAVKLVDRFAGPEPGVVPGPGWDDQRWVRFRTQTAGLSESFDSFRRGYELDRPGTTPYSTWVGVADGRGAGAPLPCYPV